MLMCECHYAVCHYAECCCVSVIMLYAVMLCVVILRVFEPILSDDFKAFMSLSLELLKVTSSNQ
jgi:hypothetical protein